MEDNDDVYEDVDRRTPVTRTRTMMSRLASKP